MSDRPFRHDAGDPGDAGLDAAIRDLIASAGADTPPAPEPSTFAGRRTVASLDGPRRRRRIAGAGAVGLTAAAGITLLAVGLGDDGGDSVILPATPSTTEPTPMTAETTTIAATTTVAPAPTTTVGPPSTIDDVADGDPAGTPADTSGVDGPPTTIDADVPEGELPFGFTPLLAFGVEDDGYRLDFAVSSNSGFDAPLTGFVEYSNDDPTRPRLEIVIAQVGPESVDPLRADDLPVFDVDGRDVFDVSPDGGCSQQFGCELYVQWDDSTGVSVRYVAGVNIDGDEIRLPGDGGLEELLDTIALLESFELGPGAPWFREVVLPYAPTIAERAFITADAGGVVAHRHPDDGQLLLDTPSSNAVGLPDGRVIVETGVPSNGNPEDLVIVDPLGRVAPFWIEGVPDDGSVRISLQDASIHDGEQVLLFVSSPSVCRVGCDQTLQAATVSWIDGTEGTSLRTVRELGFGGEGPVGVDLDGDVMLGLEQQLETKRLVSGTVSDADEEFARLVASPFEPTYSESDVLIALENSTYSVESTRERITIRDHVGDGFVEIDLDGLLPIGSSGEPLGPFEIEPNLVRSGPQILGSVWVKAYDLAPGSFIWVEVGLDGSELGRLVVDNGEFDDSNVGSLRVANR